MYLLDPWLAWHLPMSATGSIILLWLMQNAINHFRTHLHFLLHKRILVILIVLLFRNWSYLSGEKVNQPLLPGPCPRLEFFTCLPLKKYKWGYQHFTLPPYDYAILLTWIYHKESAAFSLLYATHSGREIFHSSSQQLVNLVHQIDIPRSTVFLHLNLNVILGRILAQRGLYIAPLYPRN